MQLYAIGVNHTTAPIAIRENVAFNNEILPHALSDLCQHSVAEAAIPATALKSMCNLSGQKRWLTGWQPTTS
jgi:glutamyl-tRNA reductase